MSDERDARSDDERALQAAQVALTSRIVELLSDMVERIERMEREQRHFAGNQRRLNQSFATELGGSIMSEDELHKPPPPPAIRLVVDNSRAAPEGGER